MCFSAQASFVSAALLSAIGICTVARAKRIPALIPFAAIPFFFATQQALEGITWLSLTTAIPSPLNKIALVGYLFFATVFWPIWIPATLLIVEKTRIRFIGLCSSLAVGTLISIIFLWYLLTSPQHMYVIHHHIGYYFLSNPLATPCKIAALMLYSYAIITPFFIASLPHLWCIGIMITAAWVVALVVYYSTFGSIWCFFSGLCSIFIYGIVYRYKSSRKRQRLR
jgi:hypothetical protein